jgi:5-formyltetrahydrofolate cyclo-ligase
MKKQEIRKLYHEKRLALSQKEISVFDDLLMIQFQRLPISFVSVIHSYIPAFEKKEPDPLPIIEWLKFKNPEAIVVFPKINAVDFSMNHYVHTDNTLFESNQYGIPEPITGDLVEANQIDLAIIPMLAFDQTGNRVGYGKGYYDRFIAQSSNNMIKIGLSYFPPLSNIEDLGLFDKKLDFCVTPDRFYAF